MYSNENRHTHSYLERHTIDEFYPKPVYTRLERSIVPRCDFPLTDPRTGKDALSAAEKISLSKFQKMYANQTRGSFHFVKAIYDALDPTNLKVRVLDPVEKKLSRDFGSQSVRISISRNLYTNLIYYARSFNAVHSESSAEKGYHHDTSHDVALLNRYFQRRLYQLHYRSLCESRRQLHRTEPVILKGMLEFSRPPSRPYKDNSDLWDSEGPRLRHPYLSLLK